MAFADEDLRQLADDFIARADSLVVTPGVFERRGVNAGYNHFSRSQGISKPVTAIQPRPCYRCKQLVYDAGRLCVRHKEQHRIWATQRNRRKGVREWVPGGKGRPPNITRSAEDVDVRYAESRLSDALEELTSLTRRVNRLRQGLTQARRSVRSKQLGEQQGLRLPARREP